MRMIRLFKNEMRLFVSHRAASLMVLAFVMSSLAPVLMPDRPAGIPSPAREPITVGGITLTGSNPIYSDMIDYLQVMSLFEAGMHFLTPAQLEKAQEFNESQAALFARFASAYEGREEIAGYYRDVFMQARFAHDYLFILDNISSPAVRWLFTNDFVIEKPDRLYTREYPDREYDRIFINITAAEKESLISSQKDILRMAELVLEGSPDGFRAYADLRLADYSFSVGQYGKTIEAVRAQIAMTPPGYPTAGLEENIRYCKAEIEKLNAVDIRGWEIRKAHGVIPFDNSWRDLALRDFEYGYMGLKYLNVMSEQEFSLEPSMQAYYGSYRNYTAETDAQKAGFEMRMSIAGQSLEAGMPDISYVEGGARQSLIRNLSYSNYVYILASLIGAWLLASEFQSGTIRLLLVRPVSRSRLLMRKYTAGLSVCIAAFLSGTLLNLTACGLVKGFSDLANPVYDVTGPVSYWAVYLPKLFVCAFPAVFAYSLAFFLSVCTRTSALSAVAPLFLFAASMNAASSLKDGVFSGLPGWLAYTPVPYIDVSAAINSAFFKPVLDGSQIRDLGEAAMSAAEGFPLPSAAACAGVLFSLSLLLTAGSVAVFTKTDVKS